jgi:hypothetical protein
MMTASRNSSYSNARKVKKQPLSFTGFIVTIFMVNLRESLDARSRDTSDAAFGYGLWSHFWLAGPLGNIQFPQKTKAR